MAEFSAQDTSCMGQTKTNGLVGCACEGVAADSIEEVVICQVFRVAVIILDLSRTGCCPCSNVCFLCGCKIIVFLVGQTNSIENEDVERNQVDGHCLLIISPYSDPDVIWKRVLTIQIEG
jgi:hypothetical protein